MAEAQGSAASFRTLATLGVVGTLGTVVGLMGYYAIPQSTEPQESPRSRAFDADWRAVPHFPAASGQEATRSADSAAVRPRFAEVPAARAEGWKAVPAPKLTGIGPAEELPRFSVADRPHAASATGSASIRLVVETYDATAKPAGATPAVVQLRSSEDAAALPPAIPPTGELGPPELAGVSVFPAMPALDKRRAELDGYAEVAAWKEALDAELATLQRIDDWSDPTIGQTCVALAALIDQARKMAYEVTDPVAALAIQEIGYDIERRVDLWSQIHATTVSRANEAAEASNLSDALAGINASLDQHPERDVWRTFLLLPDLEKALADEASLQLRAKAEGAIFARFRHSALTPDQKAYLAQPEFERFLAALTIWSLGPNPVLRVPAELEEFELTRSQTDGARLARICRAFHHSQSPSYLPIAESLERHYRNANLRVSVGKSFITRFVPQPQVTELPVRESIRGAWVSGRSETLTRLGVDFVPAEGELQFKLTVEGEVASATTASAGPARVFNDGTAWFVGAKPLAISPEDFRKNPTTVQVRSRSLLKGFRTEYDGVPLIGSIVRNQVEQRVEEERALADRETSSRVASRIESYVDDEVERRLADAEGRFRDKALSPLAQLGIELSAVELETTADRAVARYRLAHPEQLAAFTPRPQALAVSEISVQLHESAFNNVFSQTDLFGREMLLTEMLTRVRALMGAPDGEPMDVPEGVSIRLADRDGAKVVFEDDQVVMELNVKRIAENDETLYRNFVIRARYRPVVEGLQVKLVRTGVLELSGDRLDFRQQIALRAIFSKVFSENRALTLLKEEYLDDPRVQGLAVGQIIMNQGWLGVSLVPGMTRIPTQVAPAPDQPELR